MLNFPKEDKPHNFRVDVVDPASTTGIYNLQVKLVAPFFRPVHNHLNSFSWTQTGSQTWSELQDAISVCRIQAACSVKRQRQFVGDWKNIAGIL